MSKMVTRRSFLVSTAVAAGVSSQVMNLALAEPEMGDEAAPIPPVEPPEAWDEEFDLVVAGAGGGLAAAVRAAEAGARVLLVDKMSETGGSSKEASVWVAPGTRVQLDLGMPDLSEALVGAAAESAPFGERYPLYSANCMASAIELVNWSIDQGFQWQPTTVTGGPGPVGISPAGSEEGGMTARAVMYVYRFLEERFVEAGGDLRLFTTLDALCVEDGRVVGVSLSDPDGNPYKVAASQGVVIATGGMGANKDMLAKYIPTVLEVCKFSSAGAQDSGDGIRMGLGVGAQIDGFDCFDQFDGGIDGVDWNTYMYISAVQIARQPWLGITRFGERYPYIPGGGAAEYTASAAQLNSLPGHEGFVFFDDLFEQYGPTFKQGMCRLLIDADTMPDEGRVPEVFANPHWYDGVREAIASGLIKSSDTIEGLAEELGLDPDKVVKAVDDWNALCEAGTDPEGKMPDEFLYPIAQPPFYGMAIGAFTFATHCGLTVDGEGRVLDTKGNAIPGLFASGCAVGLPIAQANGSCCFASASAWLAAGTALGL